jgi:histidinol phosphatase-like PHP family hydrolase
MKKIIFTILSIAAISFAIELCNSGAFEIQAPVGSCTNEGYVCNVSTDQNGGVMFKLGKDSNCIEIDTTKFTTYPMKSTMELDTDSAKKELKLYMMEDALEKVGALAVSTNTAFIINALNEKFKVCVNYHRAAAAQTINDYNFFSIRLQSIQKCN